MFFTLGPWLIARLGPVRCAGLSALAGVLRWGVMGATTWMPALAGAPPLHGLTFALLHRVAMGIIAKSVPERLAATAQTVYGALALGIASAALTFESGYFYGWLGIRAFWAMAALCAFALPLVGGIVAPSPREVANPSLSPEAVHAAAVADGAAAAKGDGPMPGASRRVVQIGAKMRIAPCFPGRRLPPVEQVDAVGLEKSKPSP